MQWYLPLVAFLRSLFLNPYTERPGKRKSQKYGLVLIFQRGVSYENFSKKRINSQSELHKDMLCLPLVMMRRYSL